MPALFQSRRFWLAILDAVTGTLGVTLALFLAPDSVKIVLTIWGIWQPVIVAIIIGYTVENTASIHADVAKYSAGQNTLQAQAYVTRAGLDADTKPQ